MIEILWRAPKSKISQTYLCFSPQLRRAKIVQRWRSISIYYILREQTKNIPLRFLYEDCQKWNLFIFHPLSKKKQVKFFSKKTFLFPFKKQAEITKFPGSSAPRTPHKFLWKYHSNPYDHGGGLVGFENTVSDHHENYLIL